MTAKMYYDNDADPAALAGKTVAIIGYGSQGHAHALNLHESGVDVVVGLAADVEEPGRWSRTPGIRVADVADAVRAADVVMILVPDTAQKAVYDSEIGPNLRPGALLMFAHGFNIHFNRIDPPAGIDVGMVAPEGPRAPAAQRLPGRRRRARPVRGLPRRDRHGPGQDPGLCPGDRRDPGRRPRDDVRRGDRDRPVRRAVGPVRRARRPS